MSVELRRIDPVEANLVGFSSVESASWCTAIQDG
jgi:hypothetical protein